MKNIIIIHHKNCMDGVSAAYIAYRKFGNDAEYIACDDRTILPDYILNHNNLKEVEIYILDFSFSKETLLGLENKVKKLVILDHHIGAKESIESVKEHVFGDMISGAYLSSQYFFPEENIPLFIRYVSDNDTWTHQMPDYNYINSYIYRTDKVDFEFIKTSIAEFVEAENDPIKYLKIKSIGKILYDSRESVIKKYIEKAELVNFEGYDVYAINSPSEIKSELGHELANKTNSFSILYYFEDNKWKVSLRSVQDFDVSEIAKRYGGGGHKNAAAFILNDTNPILKLIKNQNI